MYPKIQNFQNFQKIVTYVIQPLVVYQCTKFQINSSISDPQMECFLSPKSYPFVTCHVFLTPRKQLYFY